MPSDMPFLNLDEAAMRAAQDQTAFRLFVVQELTASRGELKAHGEALKELRGLPAKVATLESELEVLGGNGNPGLVQVQSAQIRNLERFSYLVTGALLLLGTLIGWGWISAATIR